MRAQNADPQGVGTLKVGYRHDPDFYYYFYPHPNSTVLDLLVLIDGKSGNAKAVSVRKLRKTI